MALHAWRCWRVDPDGGLRSLWVQIHAVWEPGPVEAGCHRVNSSFMALLAASSGVDLPPAPAPHDTPGRDCDCGWYSALTPVFALQQRLTAMPWVLGTVKVWGRVIPHRDGYRSQWCRPTSLVLPPPTVPARPSVEAAAARYQLPTIPHDELAHMEA